MSVSEREAGKERLSPSLFGRMASRYYYLRQLKKQIETAANTFLSNKLGDYGCGNKLYESLFRPYVRQYIGIDLYENKNADIAISSLGVIDVPDEVVLSTQAQVLEHVIDPKHYLQEARRTLKTGGLLILSTHDYWVFRPDPTDFWRWASTGLQKIIHDEGFEILHFKGVLGRMPMGLQLFQDGILFKLPKSLRSFLALIFQPLIIFFDKLTSTTVTDKDAYTCILS